MKSIARPRHDNPRMERNEATHRIRLICTDCSPEMVVTDRDVSYWNDMPLSMVESDGRLRGAEDMVVWLNHMRDVHGIVPNFTGTIEI